MFKYYFIFSENACVYILKTSDNIQFSNVSDTKEVSVVSGKQQNTVIIKDTINEMGLLDQQNLLCTKIHLPASLHALANTLTIKKTQKMLVTEETGYAAYGNSVQSSRFFYKSKNSTKIGFKKIQEEMGRQRGFSLRGDC